MVLGRKESKVLAGLGAGKGTGTSLMARWVHMGTHSNEVFASEAQAALTSKEPVVSL